MNLELVKQNLLDKQAEITSRVDRTHNHIHHREEPVSAGIDAGQKTRLEKYQVYKEPLQIAGLIMKKF